MRKFLLTIAVLTLITLEHLQAQITEDPVTGNVGIGTSTPQSKLTVNGNIRVGNDDNFLLYNGAADIIFRYQGRGSGGRALVHDEGNILTFNYAGDFSGGTRISNNVYFSTGSSSSYILSGDVGIGTSDTKGYKLAVAGNLIAERIRVKPVNAWPDYVFHPGYSLPPLSDVEKYIKDHRHLPEIPSARQIEKEGLDVGEMNRKLLQKIEELTLYIIDLKKENNELKDMSADLLKRVQKLENQ